MLFHHLLPLSTLALSARAFLVPLEAANPNIPALLDLHLLQTQTIRLDCSTCPFVLPNEPRSRLESVKNIKSDLELQFSTTEEKKLALNGVPFYPYSFRPLPPALRVKQIAKGSQLGEQEQAASPHEIPISYSLEIAPEKSFPNTGKGEAEIINIVMTVMGLDSQMVKIDNVVIKVLKHSDNELTIISLSTAPSPSDAPDAKCTTIMCRVFSKLSHPFQVAKSTTHAAAHKLKICCQRFSQLFPTFGRHPPHRHTSHKQIDSQGKHLSALPIQFHPKVGGHVDHAQTSDRVQSPHPHSHHHHRNWLHTLLAGTKRIISLVLLPILTGIMVGVTASATGMLVGRLVVFLWAKWRGPKVVLYERVEEDEKDELKDELPAYEEIRGVMKVTEKA